MTVLLILYIIGMLCVKYKFVSLLERDGALKSVEQIKKHHKLVEKQFPGDSESHSDPLHESWNFSVFMYLNGKDLVAYGTASFVHGVVTSKGYFGMTNTKARLPVISLYSLMVTKAYRGEGLCKDLVMESVDCFKNEYGLGLDTLILLHISPKDELMHVAAKIYYRMGFTKGVFCSRGPSQFHYDLDHLLENSHDLYDLINDPRSVRQRGGFVTLYCRLKDLGKPVDLPEDCINKGLILKKFLKARQGASE